LPIALTSQPAAVAHGCVAFGRINIGGMFAALKSGNAGGAPLGFAEKISSARADNRSGEGNPGARAR
jgi:hypothetical protein